MEQFVENDPNFDRSAKSKRSVMDEISYQQLMNEQKRKTQFFF